MRQIGIALTVAAGAVFSGAIPGMAADSGSSANGIFKKLDKNHDGRLTREEVGQERARIFDRLLKQGDADKDGALSQSEFLAATKKRTPSASQPQDRRKRGRPSPDQLFQRLDKNNDGKLTLDEIPEKFRGQMKKLFERLGKDSLTKEDFVKLRRGGKGRPNPEQFFKRFDKNNDGKLTLDEIPEKLRRRVRPLFQRLGKDSLTKEDLAKLFKGHGRKGKGNRKRPDTKSPAKGKKLEKSSGKRKRNRKGRRGKRPNVDQIVTHVFSRFDKNGDGKISKDEAPSRMKEHFAELDANGDGVIEKTEFKTQLEKRFKNRQGGQRGRGKNRKKRKRPSQE